MLQPLGQGAPVRQPGQRVGEGPADQVLLGAPAVGDVDQREDDELRRRHQRCCDLYREHIAALKQPLPA